MRRVLFVSEAITLAQMVRLVALAETLDPKAYEVHFASARFPDLVFGATSFRRWPLDGVDVERLHRAHLAGRPMYDTATLRRYVTTDLELFDAVQPHVVVGDFRWSLTVSAPVARVPHLALANAYMSPFARRDGFPLPEHPILRLLGERARGPFERMLPRVFRRMAAPVNALRRDHGLAPLDGLLHVLTHGDLTLYCDPPELVALDGAPTTHRFVGYVPWAPRTPLPERLPSGERPIVYATMGSSGDTRALTLVIETLTHGFDVDVIAATAGRVRLDERERLFVADYWPGDWVMERAALAITNGGSTSGYQALAGGVPVLGIPANFEQLVASRALDTTGAARSIPGGRVTRRRLHALTRSLLESDDVHHAARAVRRSIARLDYRRAFVGAVEDAIAPRVIDERGAASA